MKPPHYASQIWEDVPNIQMLLIQESEIPQWISARWGGLVWIRTWRDTGTQQGLRMSIFLPARGTPPPSCTASPSHCHTQTVQETPASCTSAPNLSILPLMSYYKSNRRNSSWSILTPPNSLFGFPRASMTEIMLQLFPGFSVARGQEGFKL